MLQTAAQVGDMVFLFAQCGFRLAPAHQGSTVLFLPFGQLVLQQVNGVLARVVPELALFQLSLNGLEPRFSILFFFEQLTVLVFQLLVSGNDLIKAFLGHGEAAAHFSGLALAGVADRTLFALVGAQPGLAGAYVVEIGANCVQPLAANLSGMLVALCLLPGFCQTGESAAPLIAIPDVEQVLQVGLDLTPFERTICLPFETG